MEEIKFRQTKNNQTIAIKEGEVVGGAGSCVGPDKLPSLDSFLSQTNEVTAEDSFAKKVRAYLTEYFQGKEVDTPKGLPKAEKIVFTRRGIRETASKMNPDKAKVLPFIFDIYRTGTYAGSKQDQKNHDDVSAFHYTEKTIEVEGKRYRVTLVSQEFENNSAEYVHYLIGKADAEDTKKAPSQFPASQIQAGLTGASSRTNILADHSAKVQDEAPSLHAATQMRAGLTGASSQYGIVKDGDQTHKKTFEFVDLEIKEMSDEVLAQDESSVRRNDSNGFLHVAISPLTREQVAPYWGNEIPGWDKLGLDPDKTYYVYRPAAELSRKETIQSINAIPVQLRHHADYAHAPAKTTRVGTTGTDGKWQAPYLMNSLHIFDEDAQKHIEDNTLRELSLAYSYRPEMTAGTAPSGEHYDLIMRDILANHVALVEEGRAGRDVLVLDSSKERKMDTKDEKKSAATAQDSNPAVEAAEVALAQAIIGLHEKKPDGSTEDVMTDESIRGEVQAIIDKVVAKGFPEDRIETLREALLSFAKPSAEPGNAATADEGAAAGEETSGSGKAEDADEQTVCSDEDLKACGYDEASPEIQKAFAEGVKYGEKKEKQEPQKLDSEHESAGEKKALSEDAAYNRLRGELIAIDEVKPVLGVRKIGAYDSAGGYYLAALEKLGVKDVPEAMARQSFLMYMQGRNAASPLGTRSGMAQDSKPQEDGLLKELNNVKTYI